MQLLVFDTPVGTAPDELARKDGGEYLREKKIGGVVYADAMSPRGIGLLTWSEDPAHFVRSAFVLSSRPRPCPRVELRPGYAMIGRTYATGHEPDLEFVLLRRAIGNVLESSYDWHVWYPLRRTGEFARIEPIEQSHILREHAALGMAYGQAELAHDVRLACHGLDAEDNEFVNRSRGSGAAPPVASHFQAMRKTRQTSQFIAKMGPFFIGHVAYRVAAPEAG